MTKEQEHTPRSSVLIYNLHCLILLALLDFRLRRAPLIFILILKPKQLLLAAEMIPTVGPQHERQVRTLIRKLRCRLRCIGD